MKVYEHSSRHITKRSTMSIYDKTPLKSSSTEPKDLETWYVALGMWDIPNLFK